MTRPHKVPEFIYNPPDIPLSVVHVDDYVLVVSKPAGLLSVPGKAPEHADCLETRVKEEFPEALLVHRLDMETSGLMVFAMNKDVQGNLGKQFERRKVTKTYTAHVWGHVEGESGSIDLPLRCDWPNRPLQMVCHEHGKPSVTNWEVQARIEKGGVKSSLMRLTPITGRSHQLRVHMMELNKENGGHPILGDPFYAHEEALEAADRLMLHATTLSFHHPEDGRIVEFKDVLE